MLWMPPCVEIMLANGTKLLSRILGFFEKKGWLSRGRSRNLWFSLERISIWIQFGELSINVAKTSSTL